MEYLIKIGDKIYNRAYAYIRVSTETQVREGQGLQAQIDKILEFCEKNDIPMPEENIFIEEGVSGTVFAEREQLQELLSKLKPNDVVIVLNTSRLWREDDTKVLVVQSLKRKKAHVKSIEQDNYDLYTKNPNDKFFNTLIEALDVLDRDNIAMKLARGRKTKAKGGVKGCGRAPLAYEWKHDGVDKPEVVINTKEAKLVQLIFEKYLELKSIGKLNKFLTENEYKTKKGNNFSDMALREILTNSFYIGRITWGKEDEFYEGEHEAIISEEMFEKVQQELKNKKRGGRPKTEKAKLTKEEMKLKKAKEQFVKERKEKIEKELSLSIKEMEDEMEEDALLRTIEKRRKRLESELETEVKERFAV